MIHTKLDNGLEVVIKANHASQLLALQCWVHCGSLDEKPSERGMSHLIEHMLFKGTDRRKVGEIAATVEACGGDINAYTTFDRTVFYLTMTSNHKLVACDLLADAIFHSAFDADELTREKEVVVEEIRRSLDNPASKVGRRVFSDCFAGTEAGRPIIGSEESVRGFGREDILGFHRHWYRPDNMSVVVVGDFDEEEMLANVQKYFGLQGQRAPLARERSPIQRVEGVNVHLMKGDYEQPRLEITHQTPELSHPDTPALDVMAFAMGSGDLSRLNRELRDHQGVATAVAASLYSPNFGGVLSFSAYPVLDKFTECVAGIASQVKAVRESLPVDEQEIERARVNLKADKLHDEETISGIARSLGFGLTTDHKLYFDDVYLAMIDKLAPADIASAAERWLNQHDVTIVAMVPESSSLEKEDIEQAYKSAMGTPATAKHAVRPSDEPKLINVKPGLDIVYRHNPDARFFNMIAAAEGGLRYEPAEQAGMYHAMSSMLALANERHDYASLLHAIEGMGAALEGFSGKDSFGYRLQCLTDFAPKLLAHFSRCFMQPVMPDQQWQTLQREIAEDIRTESDSSAQVCLRNFQKALYQEHPYHRPVYGFAPTVERLNPSLLMTAYNDVRDRADWVVGCVSSMSESQVVEQIGQTFEKWRRSDAARQVCDEPTGDGRNASIHVPKEREQSHLFVGGPGLTWGASERPALDVLNTILGGQGGRLFLNLRDQKSLAYSVSPVVNYGVHQGFAGVYIACAPAKVEEALASIRTELEAVSKIPVEAEELNRAINYIRGSHAADMQRGMSQAMTMALMQAYGVGYDDFLQYGSRIANVTSEQVQAVAQSLFDPSRLCSVVVGPES